MIRRRLLLATVVEFRSIYIYRERERQQRKRNRNQYGASTCTQHARTRYSAYSRQHRTPSAVSRRTRNDDVQKLAAGNPIAVCQPTLYNVLGVRAYSAHRVTFFPSTTSHASNASGAAKFNTQATMQRVGVEPKVYLHMQLYSVYASLLFFQSASPYKRATQRLRFENFKKKKSLANWRRRADAKRVTSLPLQQS